LQVRHNIRTYGEAYANMEYLNECAVNSILLKPPTYINVKVTCIILVFSAYHACVRQDRESLPTTAELGSEAKQKKDRQIPRSCSTPRDPVAVAR
jgi:hypothetical protein